VGHRFGHHAPGPQGRVVAVLRRVVVGDRTQAMRPRAVLPRMVLGRDVQRILAVVGDQGVVEVAVVGGAEHTKVQAEPFGVAQRADARFADAPKQIGPVAQPVGAAQPGGVQTQLVMPLGRALGQLPVQVDTTPRAAVIERRIGQRGVDGVDDLLLVRLVRLVGGGGVGQFATDGFIEQSPQLFPRRRGGGGGLATDPGEQVLPAIDVDCVEDAGAQGMPARGVVLGDVEDVQIEHERRGLLQEDRVRLGEREADDMAFFF